MYRLIRDNIEKIVNDTSEKEKLMYDGFKLLEDKKNINIENLGIEELKNLAKENGIEGYSKLKKDELIEKLNSI
ncbi:Rho termination factor N-terminal domain-containing protein [Clostridioides difficile]|uniref:Rho termination factor N-terminal domain-containing protein n=1 Tax=Clostridioides difficile TaxID=1496 RepID=UPI00082680F8|nr:Rho termination factor N-terminal domain-containing protein [Clostridioides difficile]MCI9920095.1 Rho termination factor N-terminal domain-containing protein [Clostridioides difficile]MCI9927401.1 Rho termination factor N-terminal domain-containing protein [Clostridioides difficile]MCI9931147.1 Rho termination factor N-terminal domain-containing protein [Clostridioides difficile]MCM4098821.1 Rho termination factor N-terminal domain-containing protein [Clostridioides difficile]MDB3138908.1 